MSDSAAASPWPQRWQRFSASSRRAFHAYANWLVGISWKRFVLLSVLLLLAAGILQHLPPFRWGYTETVPAPSTQRPAAKSGPGSPDASSPRKHEPLIHIEKGKDAGGEGIEISIDERGVRIRHKAPAASGAAASGAAASAADSDANDDAEGTAAAGDARPRERIRVVRLGDALPELAMFWIVASMIVKITYKRQIQAEAQAAQAVETAEAESLRRQVVEARMAAMQAQVEPHFLFNTLASIDHLIEVDPKRASAMQKNLIALLRASMPTMREAGDGGARDLGHELALIRPYLEILKVRMEERLTTAIDVPDGLLSAEFPQMMMQTLVENAIKHGLEPKPEGGQLRIRAEIVHGKLAVTVADTGLGFGRAATAGTGVGLANVRERLQLLYGTKAALTLAENPGGGTVATITVPYKPLQGDAA